AVISLHGYFEVVPFARFQRLLAFRRGHLHPAAPTAFVESAGMLANAGVHFHLHPFDVRAMLGIDSRNARMEKDAAVASGFALELEAQVEIAIGLFGRQVAIFVGGAFAQDGALLDYPFFRAIIFPACQILAVEKRYPSVFRLQRTGNKRSSEQRR